MRSYACLSGCPWYLPLSRSIQTYPILPVICLHSGVPWHSIPDINNLSQMSFGVDATSNYSHRWNQSGPAINWLPFCKLSSMEGHWSDYMQPFGRTHISLSATVLPTALCFATALVSSGLTEFRTNVFFLFILIKKPVRSELDDVSVEIRLVEESKNWSVEAKI